MKPITNEDKILMYSQVNWFTKYDVHYYPNISPIQSHHSDLMSFINRLIHIFCISNDT